MHALLHFGMRVTVFVFAALALMATLDKQFVAAGYMFVAAAFVAAVVAMLPE